MTSSFLSTSLAAAASGAAGGGGVPRTGPGLLLTVNPALGYAYSAKDGKGASFKHNFRPFLSALGLRLTYGTLGTFEPKIGALRMSQAVLKLDPGEATAAGESWACVEVETNADGRVTDPEKVRVIHTKDPGFSTPTKAREPLALIIWRKRLPVRVEPIRMWCMTHHRIQESATSYLHVFL